MVLNSSSKFMPFLSFVQYRLSFFYFCRFYYQKKKKSKERCLSNPMNNKRHRIGCPRKQNSKSLQLVFYGNFERNEKQKTALQMSGLSLDHKSIIIIMHVFSFFYPNSLTSLKTQRERETERERVIHSQRLIRV